MKKNITINLCGRLYAIDEDAYELLNHYTDTLRNYFRKQEGGEEIANDIEERIAELFDELKENGVEAITIEHVQDIISRVGELKDIAPEGEAASEASDAGGASSSNGEAKKNTWVSESFDERFKTWWNGLKGKKFYRSADDKVIAGVLGGCAQFFGGSSLLWRIGYIVLAFTSLNIFRGLYHLGGEFSFFYFRPSFTLLYILVAVLAPVAVTPEDRLKMKGKEVNPQTLSNEVSEASKVSNSPEVQKQDARGCLGQFFSVVGKMVLMLLTFFCILLAIPGMVFVGMFVAYLTAPEMMIENVIDRRCVQDFLAQPECIWGLAISTIVTCFVPAFCALHSVFCMLKKVEPMGFMQRVVWTAVWVLAVAGIVASGVKMADIVRSAYHDDRDEYRFEYDEDGVTVVPDSVAADTVDFANENVTVKEHASDSKVDTLQSIRMRDVRRYARKHHMSMDRAELELLKQRRRNGDGRKVEESVQKKVESTKDTITNAKK